VGDLVRDHVGDESRRRDADDRDDQAAWKDSLMREHYYHKYSRIKDDLTVKVKIDKKSPYAEIFRNRPKFGELPPFTNSAATIETKMNIDFGSYRDVQRHRNGCMTMPLLEPGHFHPWYIEQLPVELQEKAKKLIKTQEQRLKVLADPYLKQYYLPMGNKVTATITQGINAFIYRVELRTSKTVHPTLRSLCQGEAKKFQSVLPEYKLYPDMDEDSWTVRRGKQDITEK
jgi:hypothetical protein